MRSGVDRRNDPSFENSRIESHSTSFGTSVTTYRRAQPNIAKTRNSTIADPRALHGRLTRASYTGSPLGRGSVVGSDQQASEATQRSRGPSLGAFQASGSALPLLMPRRG